MELRTCIDAIRLHYGLSPYPYIDPTVTSAATAIKAQHLADLRTALTQAYAAANIPPPGLTDGILSGQTAVRAVHFSELRTAIRRVDSVLH